MSIPFGVPLAIAAAAGLLPAPFAFFRARAIGPFIANVTVEENHVDELAITDHPVDRNGVITDHSYKRPEQVTIKCGYSNSSLLALSDPNYVQGVYAQFLALQASREPFEIITGKRVYTSMLIARLATITDEKTENALMLDVACRQIIIVDTQTVTVSQPDVQKDPASNAPLSNEGTRSAVPATVNDASLKSSAPGVPSGYSSYLIPITATPAGSAASVGVTPLSTSFLGG